AQELGLGVNAGHDLDSKNLARFLEIPQILEVSIGHVLTVECLLEGMPTVIKRYLDICKGSN
ncbi:MAG: pyridoxine 5'-phosphate synthase, partial [Xanthomonadales bacterium]|nr:pyridoxine 5'-phosphate synthase [Xanthomonadales bacterium]